EQCSSAHIHRLRRILQGQWRRYRRQFRLVATTAASVALIANAAARVDMRSVARHTRREWRGQMGGEIGRHVKIVQWKVNKHVDLGRSAQDEHRDGWVSRRR